MQLLETSSHVEDWVREGQERKKNLKRKKKAFWNQWETVAKKEQSQGAEGFNSGFFSFSYSSLLKSQSALEIAEFTSNPSVKDSFLLFLTAFGLQLESNASLLTVTTASGSRVFSQSLLSLCGLLWGLLESGLLICLVLCWSPFDFLFSHSLLCSYFFFSGIYALKSWVQFSKDNSCYTRTHTYKGKKMEIRFLGNASKCIIQIFGCILF